MSFCPNCGIYNNSNDTNCSSCGADLTGTIQDTPDSKPKKKQTSNFVITAIGIGVVAFFALIMVSILLAMATPNFEMSRAEARRKSCFSNIRVLSGAIEMYNMDNTSFISTDLNLKELVKGRYLKSEKNFTDPDLLPEKSCEYHIRGDFTQDGLVYCKYHGDIPSFR